MNASGDQIDPRLEKKLLTFRPVPPRDPQSMARGRANFLEQAGSLAQAVSARQNERHIRWIDPISQLFRRKERSPMFAPLVSFLLAISLLAGGGATVYAAQDSLPGQPLYAMKMTSENFRLGLATDAQSEMNLNLAFAHRRVNEINAMAAEGWLPPQTVESRWQAQLDRALELAAGMQAAALQAALERIRQNLQAQAQQMQQAQASLQDRPQAQAVLDRVRERIRERLNWVEAGLKDPQRFRQQFHRSGAGAPSSGSRSGDPGQPDTRTPLSGSGFGPGPNATCTQTPGSSYGPGPGAGQTTGEGKSYGPGPNAVSTPTPAGAYGPGPGPDSGQTQNSGSSNGPGPNATQTPVSGSGPPETGSAGQDGGYGPGPQPGSTCTPQAGAGPDPNPEPGNEGSGGDAHHASEPGSCTGCGDHGGKP